MKPSRFVMISMWSRRKVRINNIFIDGHGFYLDGGKQTQDSGRKIKGPVLAQLGFRCQKDNKGEMSSVDVWV